MTTLAIAEAPPPQFQVIQLVARLTAAPELNDRNGTQVGRLRLAVQRPRGKDGEDRGADFVDVTVFGRQAQTCAQYLEKGRKVAVEGHLHHSEWETDDGSRRQKLEVIARNVEFLDRKPTDDQQPQPRRRSREPRRLGGTPRQGRPANQPPSRRERHATPHFYHPRPWSSGASGSTRATNTASSR